MEEESLSERVRAFIKSKRKALGLSQSELAVLIFNDIRQQQYISQLENGTRDLRINNLERILKVLNADVTINEY